MAEYDTVTLSADVTAGTQVFKAMGPIRGEDIRLTLQAAGTFGGGTLTYLLSLDGGTNKVQVKDSTGTAYTATSDDIVTLDIPVAGASTNQAIVYVKLTGATTPSITVVPISNQ